MVIISLMGVMMGVLQAERDEFKHVAEEMEASASHRARIVMLFPYIVICHSDHTQQVPFRPFPYTPTRDTSACLMVLLKRVQIDQDRSGSHL